MGRENGEEGCATQVEKRLEKHAAIQGAIGDLDSVIGNLDALISTIKQEPLCDTKKVDTDSVAPASLSSFLAEGEDIIRRRTERIAKILAELKELLF